MRSVIGPPAGRTWSRRSHVATHVRVANHHGDEGIALEDLPRIRWKEEKKCVASRLSRRRKKDGVCHRNARGRPDRNWTARRKGMHQFPRRTHGNGTLQTSIPACVTNSTLREFRLLTPFRVSDWQVESLAVSPDGRYVASAEKNPDALILVWDLHELRILHKLKLHVGNVQTLDFSCDSKHLASVGCVGDRRLVLWHVQTGTLIGGKDLEKDDKVALKSFTQDPTRYVLGGEGHLGIWNMDIQRKQFAYEHAVLGGVQRNILSLDIDSADEFAYCGTSSGDIVKVCLSSRQLLAKSPPVFPSGTTVVKCKEGGLVIGGSGCGKLYLLQFSGKQARVISKGSVEGEITSIFGGEFNKGGNNHFFCTTSKCTYFHCLVSGTKIRCERLVASHSGAINDIAFADNFDDVFATCSQEHIRLWELSTLRELVMVASPGNECLCVTFTRDGKSILSGWTDGVVRSFIPSSGEQRWTLNDAHKSGVTAICSCSDSSLFITGGRDGNVRVWKLGPTYQKLLASLKEHRGSINDVCMSGDGKRFVSAASDGSCIVWDLDTHRRVSILQEDSFFASVRYHPDNMCLVTVGSNRRLGYWSSTTGEQQRSLEASEKELSTVAVSPDGRFLVTGGADRRVCVWDYRTMRVTHSGNAHMGSITKAIVSPIQQHVITVDAEGGLFIWGI